MTPSAQTLSIAVLAGGLGRRLGPAAARTPKALVSVNGEPFIAHQLRLLRRQGLTKVLLCVGHLGKQIEDFVGDGSRFGVAASYSRDGDLMLGTGGALRKALPFLGNPFWVIYGDSYLDIDLAPIAELFFASEKLALMTVLRNENRWDRSNALFKEGRVARYDKKQPSSDMAHIDYGFGLLRKTAFEPWGGQDAFDLGAVYGRLADQGELLGYEVSRRFYEIGSLAGLADTEAYLRKEGKAWA